MNDTAILMQPDHAFYTEHEAAAMDHALRNALRRIVRCLFAERIVDPGQLVFAPQGHAAWLPLWQRRAVLYFDDLRAAPAATFINRGAITLVGSGARTPVDTPDQLIDLLREHFDFAPSDAGVDGLKADVANSVANDALARIYRQAWNAALRARIAACGAADFAGYLQTRLATEEAAVMLDQWGALEGHPFYPTWKSKPDLGPMEVAALSPEFHAVVTVRIAALRAEHAYLERMPQVDSYHAWFARQFPQPWAEWKQGLRNKGLDETQWLPLPIHAWQLEHYVRHEHAQDIADGILILDGPQIDTLPTMSFRTMMPARDGRATLSPFIKLPVALWLTSEQRSLQAKSIHMGPRVSTVIQRILAEEDGFGRMLEVFPEEVAFHYKHAVRQEDRPGRHLSVAFRASRAAFDRDDGLLPVTVAALFTASPASGRPFVTEFVERGGEEDGREQAAAWFRLYARTVVRPVLAIYLLYGIALEAHQQNSTVLFSADGLPKSLLIRDFGDGRTYAPLLNARGHTLQPYVHPGILPTVFEGDMEPVRSFVLDACFVCHLHELALLLTDEYGLAPQRLWTILGEETAAAFDALAPRVAADLWQAERAAFLEQPWPTRSVLRMHLLRYADYRLQHHLPNPLAAARGAD
jgi:D-ornithine---citrate ligase